MPIFPGPSSGGSSVLDMMLDLGASLAEYGEPINASEMGDGRPGLSWDTGNGDVRMLLENSNAENWSGIATWVIPVSQAVIDSGSLTVQIAAECNSDTTLPSCTLGVTASVVPQDYGAEDPIFITATPPSVNMVPLIGPITILSFTLSLAGVTANSTVYLRIEMQVESPGVGERAFIQIWNVRVAQAGA
jgi:hypothetical protein